MKYMSQLNEKLKRRFLATKAVPLGRHGVTWVAEASGVNRDTIYKGIHELKADEQTLEKSLAFDPRGRSCADPRKRFCFDPIRTLAGGGIFISSYLPAFILRTLSPMSSI